MNLADQAANLGPAPFFLAAVGSAFLLGLGYVLWFDPRGYGARLMGLWYSASTCQVPDGYALARRARLFAVVYFAGGAAVATVAVLGFLGRFPPS